MIENNFKLDNYNDVLNVDEVCEILQIGKNTAYTLLNSGEIRCKRFGRKFIIPKICVADFLESTRYVDLAS